MEVAKLADGGLASSLGASSNAAANLTMNGGTTLRYVGSGDSTNRNYFMTGNSNKTITFDASGSGALVMSGMGGYSNTANPTSITFSGSSAGSILNSYSGSISTAGGLVRHPLGHQERDKYLGARWQ